MIVDCNFTKKNFTYAFSSQNFQGSSSLKQLLLAGSENLHRKPSLSTTKASKEEDICMCYTEWVF